MEEADKTSLSVWLMEPSKIGQLSGSSSLPLLTFPEGAGFTKIAVRNIKVESAVTVQCRCTDPNCIFSWYVKIYHEITLLLFTSQNENSGKNETVQV